VAAASLASAGRTALMNVASGAGGALAALFRTVPELRRDRALHPPGVSAAAVVRTTGRADVGPLPGSRQYGFVARLREPSYRSAGSVRPL
jgi:hypothetical protein